MVVAVSFAAFVADRRCGDVEAAIAAGKSGFYERFRRDKRKSMIPRLARIAAMTNPPVESSVR